MAIFAIPVLVHHLGTTRFGILTLAWVFLGYFSLFDLGLGRALTQMVAREMGMAHEDSPTDLHVTVWTALITMFALGFLAGTGLAAVTPWVVAHLLKISPALQSETVLSFDLMALSIPIVLASAGLRGILEAAQQFGRSSWVRIMLGVLTFVGPLLILPFSRRLDLIVAALVGARVAACIAYFWLCRRLVPVSVKDPSFDSKRLAPLFRLGGWMTISNVVGPLMVYADRVVIGIVLSVVAVTYYATPYEVVTKLWVITGALTGVLFPAFATSMTINQPLTRQLFRSGVKFVALIMFPIILSVVIFANDGLRLWLGPEFSLRSTHVLQILAVGVLVNSMGQVAFALIQAVGRPDLTAKLHLVELPLYLVALSLLLTHAGIDGVAIAWLLRVGVDALLLFAVARKLLPGATLISRPVIAIGLICTLALALGQALETIPVRAAVLLVSLGGFAIASWFWLGPQERAVIRKTVTFPRG